MIPTSRSEGTPVSREEIERLARNLEASERNRCLRFMTASEADEYVPNSTLGCAAQALRSLLTRTEAAEGDLAEMRRALEEARRCVDFATGGSAPELREMDRVLTAGAPDAR